MSSSMCMEKILCEGEPFLVHVSNITSNQAIVESLRNEIKPLLLVQGVRDCLVMTQQEVEHHHMMNDKSSSVHSDDDKEHVVHILLALNTLQLFPKASDNFFGARFIDKDSEIVVYLRLDLGASSVYLKKIDNNSVHVQVFQPSRLNDDSPKNIGPMKKDKTKEQQTDTKILELDAGNSMALLREAMRMNQNRNDFGLSMLLQTAIMRIFKRYSHFYAMFDESSGSGVLSSIAQLVRSEIQTSNSKCLVSGRTIAVGYRPGFINAMESLNHARTSGFGYSLLRHYLKYEEPLLSYMLSNVHNTRDGCIIPFPCLYHDEQRHWSAWDYRELSHGTLRDIPKINRLQELLNDRFLQTGRVRTLSDESINQILWLVLSNRVFLSPTTVPDSDDIFGGLAKLYAFLSVDKSFEDEYEKILATRNTNDPEKYLNKLLLVYPQYVSDLFATLSTPRRNSSNFFSHIRAKKGECRKTPEYALVVQYLGRNDLASWEVQYGESMGSRTTVPRLFVWYDTNYYKHLKQPVDEISSIVSWCHQYKDTQY